MSTTVLDVVRAQEHRYHFRHHPVNPDTSIRYLYDWFEIEPDGWMRRGGHVQGGNAICTTLEPERHPDGTAINLRVFEVLDDRT